jgi:protein-disulfide isomerase
MSNVAGSTRLSKNERRDAAREKAREQRLRQQRQERRNRVVLQLGIGAVVLAIVAVIAVVLVNSVRPPGPGPRNMADDGIVVTSGLKAERSDALPAGAKPKQRAPESGKVAIRAYEDFGCPICGEFEHANAAYVQGLVKSGKATLQIYPVSFLDRSFQGTRYSTRSANAAAAVANYSPDRFYEFHRLMYAHQPAEGTTGLSDDQIIGYAKQAKVSNLEAISSAIRDHTYFNWVGDVTKRFLSGTYPLTNVKNLAADKVGTPTIFIDGKQYTGSPADANAFQQAVLSSDKFTPSASPSASPSPSPSATKTKKK